MDRRKALKNMGLSLGYVVATPTLISIAQSCKNTKTSTWTPSFFTKEEGDILIKLIDLMLPKTDTPSASEVNVHIFIDKFINEVIEVEEQNLLKTGLSKLIAKTMKDSGIEKNTTLTSKDLDNVLADVLRIPKQQILSNKKVINTYKKDIKIGKTPILNNKLTIYAFASELRSLTIWGYKTSEYVAENILAYQSIPGENIACGDLNELTEGKAWAIP